MLNWGLINNGSAFQALVNTLLLFEHPTNRVFGRPGQDGGIDAQNHSGEIIWQCKFHERPTLGKTVADATKELTRIKTYRTPGDPRAPLWQKAKRWILVTNLKLNPSDLEMWQSDVATQFQAEGLGAELWGEEKLEELLVKYPAVRDSFFEGENRNFLSLSEAYLAHEKEGPRARGTDVPVVGREDVLTQLRAFLDGDKKLICVHGMGGVGKSRLLLEFGSRVGDATPYQVLWGNVESMGRSGNWLAAILPDRPTLLLLDEPSDPRLIQALAEQMRGTSRMSGWKVVLAMRSPKDPVLKAYNALPEAIRERALTLNPIISVQAKELVLNLLNSGPLATQPSEGKEDAATHIAQISSGVPIWLTLAVRVLETRLSLRSLPASVKDIAGKYIDEVVQHQSERVATQPQIEALMRWLALYRQVNGEDSPLMEFLMHAAGFSSDAALRTALHSLVARKVVVSRGVNGRIHEIKPDVINEFILSEWLTIEDGEEYRSSPKAAEVVSAVLNGAHGKPLPNPQEVVRTLARVELREKWQDRSVKLLDPLIQALLAAAETEDLNSQRTVVGILNFFSFARVADTVTIIRTVRLNPKADVRADRILFEPKILTHQDVIYSLAWPLFTAAQYAENAEEREAILGEMIELFYANANSTAGRHNDGMKPDDLIPRLASGGRSFLSSYRDEIYGRANRLIADIQSRGDATDLELRLAKVLLQPFLALERSQTDFEQTSFNVRNWFVLPNSPDGRRRSDLRVALRTMADSPNLRLADFAWKELSEAHASANRARRSNGDLFTSDLEEDLLWVREWIRRPGTTLPALQKARGLWDWHFRFEEIPYLKQIADECEAIYAADNDAREFGVFFDQSKYEEVEHRVTEYGQSLLNATVGQLEDILTRVEVFAKKDGYWGNFMKVGAVVGGAWTTNPDIQEFVHRALGQNEHQRRFEFALAILDERMRVLRSAGDLAALRYGLTEAFAWVATDDGKKRFLFWLYSRPHPLTTGLLTTADLDFFFEHESFLETRDKLALVYRLLSGMFHTDWARVRAEVEALWDRTPEDQKVLCYFNLLDGISFIRLFHDRFPVAFGEEQFRFLLDLLLDLPDIDELEGRADYELEQIRDQLGRRPLSWLLEAFRHRIQLFDPAGTGESQRDGKIIPPHFRLSKFVVQVSAEDAAKPEVRRVVAELLDFNTRRSLGYYLPDYIHDLDPEGHLIPDLIVHKIREFAASPDLAYSWSRYAANYPLNSEPWKKIAAAAVSATASMPPRAQNNIYFSLENQIRSSSYPSGQMDPQPKIDLDECVHLEAAETNQDLLPYRAWRTKLAQAEYDSTVERYKEEQGE